MADETEEDFEFLNSLKSYYAALKGGDYKEACTLAPSLLESSSSSSLVEAIQECYAKALVQTQDYETLLQLLLNKKQPPNKGLYAYTLYRLEQYETVRERLEKESELLLSRHVKAQALFHLGETALAAEAYAALLNDVWCNDNSNDNDKEERRMELWTNWLAVVMANAVPYVESTSTFDNILVDKSEMEAFLSKQQQHLDDDEYPYDLAYNLASLDVLVGSSEGSLSRAKSLLQAAAKGVRAIMDNTNETTANELAPILANLEWSRHFWNGTVSSSSTTTTTTTTTTKGGTSSSTKQDASLPLAVQLVRQVNAALSKATSSPVEALELLQKATSDANNNNNNSTSSNKLTLTPLQRRLILYNRAVLELRANQVDECRLSCRALLDSLTVLHVSNTKKKKQKLKQQQQQQQTNGGAPNDSNINATEHTSNSRTLPILPAACPEDQLWWESRVAVLEAYCAQKSNETNASSDELLLLPLSVLKSKLEQLVVSPVRDHALCYLQLHEAELGLLSNNENVSTTADEKAITVLQSLPESIRSRRGVLASLASIYHLQGNIEMAKQLLLTNNNNNNNNDDEVDEQQALADFEMSHCNFKEAAERYEIVLMAKKKNGSDGADVSLAQARLVQALSHVDPERAKQLWSELKKRNKGVVVESELIDSEDDDDDANNGAELERRELPRLKSSHKSRKSSLLSADDMPNNNGISSNKDTTKKSQDAVLRMRARKREQHLALLEKKGLYRKDHPSKPDPERWLPKYERSSSRRRRYNINNNNPNNPQQHKGAQGGVSEKEAAKLDVAARLAARAASGETDAATASGGRSTAHLTVASHGSSGGGGGGGATGGGSRKGGRRR